MIRLDKTDFLNLKSIHKKINAFKEYEKIKYSEVEYVTRLNLIPYQIIGKRKYYEFDVFLRCYREIQKLKKERYAYKEMKAILNKRLWYKMLWNESENVTA